jgi:membrane dipeptidase
MASDLPIFDGHNDVLSRLLEAERTELHALGTTGLRSAGRSFFERSDQGHIDLPRAREGGFGGGLFSVYVSADPHAPPPAGRVLGETRGMRIMLPRPLELGYAQRTALAELGILHRLQRDSDGQLRVVRSVDDIHACLRDGALAAVIHFEGAEPIDPYLDALEVFYQTGLRSLGPVWSRANDFGEGVPYLFPTRQTQGQGSPTWARIWYGPATGSASWWMCRTSTSVASGTSRHSATHQSSPATPTPTP